MLYPPELRARVSLPILERFRLRAPLLLLPRPKSFRQGLIEFTVSKNFGSSSLIIVTGLLVDEGEVG